MISKKVLDSLSEVFGIEKSIGFIMEENYQKNLSFVGLNHGFLKFGIGIGIGFETFPVFWLVSDSVSKKFGIQKIIGFGIGKNLVLEKVSDSVSEKFGIKKSIGFGIGNILDRKKYRIRYWKYLVSEKSFGFGFVQIFGIVTH